MRLPRNHPFFCLQSRLFCPPCGFILLLQKEAQKTEVKLALPEECYSSPQKTRAWPKMASHRFWILLICLQAWHEAAGRDAHLLEIDGILGDSVTFPLNIQESQKVKNIAWISESSVAFVMPGVSGAPPTVTVTQKNYEGRIAVDQNYNLIIKDLRMEDAGTYKADINIENASHTTTNRYLLNIYKRLGKPKITQSSITLINNTCNVTLTCSVGKEEKNVTYSWSPSGKESNILQIFQTPEHLELTYTCTARNPVSNNSDSITAQQLCTDVPGLHPRHTGLLSGLAVFFLLILILSSVFLLHFCKKRQGSSLKMCTKNSDDPSKKPMHIYATVSRDCQPAEPRIYDEIPQSKELPSKEDPMKTVYSTVQHYQKSLTQTGKTGEEDNKPPKTSAYEIVV